MGRRTVVLFVAVLLAALGATLVFVYASNANNRALADQKPVRVLVAKSEIPAGTTAAAANNAGDFVTKDVASSSVATGAVSSIDGIASQVALAPIFPGEQILAAQFGTAGSVSALPIPKGDVAISVQLGDPARVAGFVQPGSSVAIFVTMTPSGGSGSAGAAATNFTRLLLQKVEVLAAGPTTITPSTTTDTTTGQTNTEQVPRAILTLAVNQTEAQKVIYASQNGQLYFGLLTNSSNVGPGAPTNATNLFN